MIAYYNEFNPKAAAMLRKLIEHNLIAPGVVDERSIAEVTAEDLKGFTQCHFFAGIGGWSVALRLANWADDIPVWTGSCPCQPFSSAGKREGKNDERHLWPAWFRLIKQCKPAAIFGEQVSSAIAHAWWDDVADDLESEGYETGAAVLPACSVGKPHKRDRLFFVGNSRQQHAWSAKFGSIESSKKERGLQQFERPAEPSFMANPTGDEKQPSISSGFHAKLSSESDTSVEWIACPDGKHRAVKSGIRLLANGVQHRAPLLHGFGNAIVPQVASTFIKAFEQYIRCRQS